MATRLVTLATFPSPMEAAIARNVLAEAGIRSETTEAASALVWSGMLGGAKLLVDEADLERAGKLLDEAFGEELDSDDETADDENNEPADGELADDDAADDGETDS
jgi:hypothetical protein